MHESRASRMQAALIGTALLVAIGVRLLFLDADPPAGGWYGFITDEGRWIETARNLYLSGTLGLYSFSELHLALSPLFQAIAWLQFEFLGLGFWQARLLSALAGCGLILVLCDLVRPFVGRWVLLALVILVGFGSEFLLPSRTVSPDIVSLFFCVASLHALTAGILGTTRLWAGMFLLAMAVLVKATTLLFAPFLALGLLWSRLSSDSAAIVLVRRNAVRAGISLLALMVILSLLIMASNALTNLLQTLSGFVSFGGAYRAAAIFLDRSLGDQAREVLPISFHVSLLGSWFAMLSVRQDRDRDFAARRRLQVTAAIWSAGCLLALTFLGYPPMRYFIFAIAPLLLLAAVAIDDGCLDRASRVGHRIAHSTFSRREVSLVSFFLPLAVLILPATVWVFSQFGVNFASMSRRVALLAFMVLGLSIAGRAFSASAAFCRRVVIFSVAGLLACASLAVIEPRYRFWSAATKDVALWACSLLIALCAVLWDAYGRMPGRMAWISGAWVALIAVVLVGDLRPLIRPQYTLNSIAADITRHVPREAELLVLKAASPLIPTNLRYREGTDNLDSSAFVFAMSCLPETCMVQPPPIIAEQFGLIAAYKFTGSYLGKPTGTKLLLLQRKGLKRTAVDRKDE